MNRRGFLGALIGGFAAAATATFTREPVTTLFDNAPITFRGMKLLWDRDCPANTVYFVNPQTFTIRYVGGLTLKEGMERHSAVIHGISDNPS
jgi:hypothetical protein